MWLVRCFRNFVFLWLHILLSCQTLQVLIVLRATLWSMSSSSILMLMFPSCAPMCKNELLLISMCFLIYSWLISSQKPRLEHNKAFVYPNSVMLIHHQLEDFGASVSPKRLISFIRETKLKNKQSRPIYNEKWVKNKQATYPCGQYDTSDSCTKHMHQIWCSRSDVSHSRASHNITGLKDLVTLKTTTADHKRCTKHQIHGSYWPCRRPC